MKDRDFLAIVLATAMSAANWAGPVSAQTPNGEIDAHIQAAKTAAGLDYRATFVNLCFPSPLPGGPRGAAALLAPRPAPDRGIWYASPYQVLGGRMKPSSERNW